MGNQGVVRYMKGIRAGIRIPLELPVYVRWKSPDHGYQEAQGKTGSISGNGLLMSISVRLPRQTPITFSIPLPAQLTQTPMELLCQGRVIRGFQKAGNSRISAVIDDYNLCPAHQHT